jgi:hypothetical protein
LKPLVRALEPGGFYVRRAPLLNEI